MASGRRSGVSAPRTDSRTQALSPSSSRLVSRGSFTRPGGPYVPHGEPEDRPRSSHLVTDVACCSPVEGSPGQCLV